MTTKVRISCVYCEGTGSILVNPSPSGDPQCAEEEYCPKCDGLGFHDITPEQATDIIDRLWLAVGYAYDGWIRGEHVAIARKELTEARDWFEEYSP